MSSFGESRIPRQCRGALLRRREFTEALLGRLVRAQDSTVWVKRRVCARIGPRWVGRGRLYLLVIASSERSLSRLRGEGLLLRAASQVMHYSTCCREAPHVRRSPVSLAAPERLERISNPLHPRPPSWRRTAAIVNSGRPLSLH